MKPIHEYCPAKNSKVCGGTCSQPGMPARYNCPYLIWAEIEKKKEKKERQNEI